MSVSQQIREAVCEREGIFNPDGYQYHHVFFKSEFFYFIDDEWNGEPVQSDIHTCIHNPGNQEDSDAGHKWEVFYKEKALERFKEQFPIREKHIALLEQIIKRKKIRYGL